MTPANAQSRGGETSNRQSRMWDEAAFAFSGIGGAAPFALGFGEAIEESDCAMRSPITTERQNVQLLRESGMT